ncbi:MAG TPA: hypothetical protein VFK05_00350 [Polyangiaceae bacterium]|nr:hypothetical protein [Polyangiaceae bacterium]
MKMRKFPIRSAAAWFCGLVLGASLLGCHSEPATSDSDHEHAGSGAGGQVAGNGGSGEVAGGSSSGAGNAPSGACQGEPDLTPTFPAVTTLDPDLVARAAAVIGSCVPDDGVARNVMHLWFSHLGAPRTYYRTVEQLACLANANCGCAAVEHCLGVVYRQVPAVCTTQCQDDVFTGCGDGARVSIDCSRVGLRCDTSFVCVAGPEVACDKSEAPSCSAQGEVTYCDDGSRHETPCQSLGFKCVAGKCVGEGASCSESVSSSTDLTNPVGTSCDGSVLHGCLGGQATSIDCATQGPGFSCQARDGKFFCGLAAECVPSNSYSASYPATTCDGTTLSFCNAGRLEHLNCTDLGFSGCEIDNKLDHYGCTPGMVLQ